MKICVIEPDHSLYDVLHHFSKSLSKALSNQGVEIITVDRNFINSCRFERFLKERGIDCTLSFNTLTDSKGEYLWNNLRFPHIFCSVDSSDSLSIMGKSPIAL